MKEVAQIAKDIFPYALQLGCGALAFWGVERAQEKWAKFKALRGDVKRAVAMLGAAVLGAGLYAFGIWMGWAPAPAATPQAWLETLIGAGAIAAGVNQLIHGGTVLAKKKG